MFFYNSLTNKLELATEFPEEMTVDEALEASIGKWKALLRLLEFENIFPGDGGTDTCALCHKFMDLELAESCENCPIMQATGKHGCDETPYVAYGAANIDGDKAGMIEAAHQEVAFLENLLGDKEYLVRMGYGPLKASIHVKKAHSKTDALAQIHKAFELIGIQDTYQFEGSKISFEVGFDHTQIYSDDIEEV